MKSHNTRRLSVDIKRRTQLSWGFDGLSDDAITTNSIDLCFIRPQNCLPVFNSPLLVAGILNAGRRGWLVPGFLLTVVPRSIVDMAKLHKQQMR